MAVRRLKIALMIAVGSVVLVAVSGQAATVVDFDPTRARPGYPVVGMTKGAGMQGIPSGRLVLFLAPSHRVADVVTSPRDGRLARFGVMTADEGDVGHFTGMVPHLAPGRYVAVAYCRECEAMFTVGNFAVTRSQLPMTGSLAAWLVRAALLIVCGTLLLRFGASLEQKAHAHRSYE